jgi:hypothetical protein
MAIIRKGILGPLSGKLGPIIGAIWKGIPYIKKVTEKKSPKVLPLRSRPGRDLGS